jgi:hypothetical protein
MYMLGLAAMAISVTAKDCSSLPPDYGIPEQCRCRKISSRLPRGGSCTHGSQLSLYPDHEVLDITPECMPHIPDNTQMCFNTRVKSCTNQDGSPEYRCGFRNFPSQLEEFSCKSLDRSCESTVFLSSVEGSDRTTFCMYKVNLSSSENCSSLRLQHRVDHPEEEYVDSLNVSHPSCRPGECKDYLQIFYGEENTQKTERYCREELANLDIALNATSFVAVYWSDNIHDPNITGSFNIRVECD